MVDTDDSADSAELTEDIAALRIATIKNPFNTIGISVRMKMGNTSLSATDQFNGEVSIFCKLTVFCYCSMFTAYTCFAAVSVLVSENS